MSNVYGRQVVDILTNKSGGGVIAGDVVIIDTTNDTAFTTTTTGAFQGSVGIAQETIANNASGRVLVHGRAALVNVPSSQTRGEYLQTHTVAKQATGTASREAGTFGQFLTGGTTPQAWIWGFPDNAGAVGETVATSAIWDAAGDLAVGTGDGAGARLAIGNAGAVLARINGAVAWNAGTSFPSAAANDRYFRTDLGRAFYYDGTRWVTTTLYRDAATNDFTPTLAANGTAGRWSIPGGSDYSDIWLVSVDIMAFVTGNSGSTYWNFDCLKGTTASSETSLGTANTSADTASNWVAHNVTVGALLTSSTNNHIRVSCTKTSTPGALAVQVYVRYRLVST